MKKAIAVILCIVMLCAGTITTFAADIQPYFNNVDRVDVSFNISSNGQATVSVKYYGAAEVIRNVNIVTKVQKKVGFLWITVNGANWTDNSTAANASKSHSVQLTSKDTYRAHVVVTVSGTGGSDDKITKNVEKVYS